MFLRGLRSKGEVDSAIRDTADKVVILRFGRKEDVTCMQLDDVVSNDDDGEVDDSLPATHGMGARRPPSPESPHPSPHPHIFAIDHDRRIPRDCI